MRLERTVSFSNAFSITLTTCMVILYTLLRQVIDGHNPGPKSHPVRFLLDTLTITLPLTILYTVGDVYNVHWNTLLLLPVFIALIFKFRLKDYKRYPALDSEYRYVKNKTYITAYRSYVTLSTIICILAVDFREIFPRRHGKSYHFGYSLMDTGVGSFIFMSGLVAPEARMSSVADSKIKILKKSLASSSVMAVIGILRTLILRAMDYDVSEDEYGKDWNFFLTLASVKILSSLVLCLYPIPNKSWILSILITVCYQTCLSYFGLMGTLEDGIGGHIQHSYGLINANREGVFSSIGMLSLYFAGLSLGSLLFKKRDTLGETLKVWRNLTGIAILSWIATWLAQNHIQDPSRCFSNLTYMTWSVAHNSTLLSLLFFMEILFNTMSHIKESSKLPGDELVLVPGGCSECFVKTGSRTSCSCLLAAISKNQLIYFLLGNVFTGIVNMVAEPHTIYYDKFTSMYILLGYMIAVNGVVSIMFVYRWTAKFW